MKIGILTHPQGANYGGLLQCYALFTMLKNKGYEPLIIQRKTDSLGILWDVVKKILATMHFPRYYKPNEIDRLVNIRPFINRYLKRTEPIKSQRLMRTICEKYFLEAVVVGSDQVWRHDFAMRYGYNYFLDFVPDNILKISYAASFGLSEWYYTSLQTQQIRALLKRFKAVSVREEDGMKLLKENLGIDAVQLIDPTLLLSAEDYDIITSPRIIMDKYVFVYWLGDKKLINGKVQAYKKMGFKIVELYLKDKQEQASVEDWLSYIKYADYVITDSFHGSVFSVIFKRQFSVFENNTGGNGRIKSLCSMLNIEIDGEKNYNIVDSKISLLREKAETYLTKYLSLY